MNPAGSLSGTVALPSNAGNTLLLAPLIVIGAVCVIPFTLTIAGFGEKTDHAAEAVRLNRTRKVPVVFTMISLPVKEVTCSDSTMVFTPLVRVAIVTPSRCHSY